MSFTNGKLHGFDVSQDAYRKQTCKRGEPGYVIGRSDLHEIACCPHKWLTTDSSDDDSTAATDWGTLLDAMLFGGDMTQFVVCPETYEGVDNKKQTVTKPWNWNATACQEWRDQQNGKQIVNPSVMREAEKARDLFRADGQLLSLITDAKFQAHCTADWTDEDTGIVVPVKILVDIVPDSANKPFSNSLADGKTARNGSVGAWPRVVNDGWYHVQAAMYLDVWNASTGDTRKRFFHAIQENTPPYETGRRELSDQFLRFGRAQYEAALKIYSQCLATGEWPGLDNAGEWTMVDPDQFMLMRAGIAPTDSDMPF